MIMQESLFITAVAGYSGLVVGALLLEGISRMLDASGGKVNFFSHPEMDFKTAIVALVVLIVVRRARVPDARGQGRRGESRSLRCKTSRRNETNHQVPGPRASSRVVFVGTIVFLYRKSQASPVVFQLDSPAKMTIIKKTVATGKVIPRREIEVKSQVSGVVEKLYVTAGQTVKKGAIIARISLRPNMLNVSAAEAQVQSAQHQPAQSGRGSRALQEAARSTR